MPFLYFDRASAHTAKLTAAAFDRIWGQGNWACLSPKSPDLSL
jgi:hypothetical protein